MTISFLTYGSQFLGPSYDFVSDEAQRQIPTLFRHHTLYKCLSMQMTLGSADKSGSRKLFSKLAWITINLRLVSLNISMSFRSSMDLKPGKWSIENGKTTWKDLNWFCWLLFRAGHVICRSRKMVSRPLRVSIERIIWYLLRNKAPGTWHGSPSTYQRRGRSRLDTRI